MKGQDTKCVEMISLFELDITEMLVMVVYNGSSVDNCK